MMRGPSAPPASAELPPPPSVELGLPPSVGAEGCPVDDPQLHPNTISAIATHPTQRPPHMNEGVARSGRTVTQLQRRCDRLHPLQESVSAQSGFPRTPMASCYPLHDGKDIHVECGVNRRARLLAIVAPLA